MDTKTIKERAKELIDNLSTNEAKLVLDLLERFNEKEELRSYQGGGGSMPHVRPGHIR